MQARTVGLQARSILEFSTLHEIVTYGDDSRSVSRILIHRNAILDETQSAQRLATALTIAGNGASTALREFRDILTTTFSSSIAEATAMSLLTGPRMYYPLLGPFGVVLGAKSRLLK